MSVACKHISYQTYDVYDKWSQLLKLLAFSLNYKYLYFLSLISSFYIM